MCCVRTATPSRDSVTVEKHVAALSASAILAGFPLSFAAVVLNYDALR